MKSRVFGIGPQMGYIFQAAPGVQGYLNFKGYYEFDAQDRPGRLECLGDAVAVARREPEQKPVIDAAAAMEVMPSTGRR